MSTLPQMALLMLEIGAIALICLLIGLWLGYGMARRDGRRQVAIFTDELRRAQSRLRTLDRARIGTGKATFGAAARQRRRAA